MGSGGCCPLLRTGGACGTPLTTRRPRRATGQCTVGYCQVLHSAHWFLLLAPCSLLSLPLAPCSLLPVSAALCMHRLLQVTYLALVLDFALASRPLLPAHCPLPPVPYSLGLGEVISTLSDDGSMGTKCCSRTDFLLCIRARVSGMASWHSMAICPAPDEMKL